MAQDSRTEASGRAGQAGDPHRSLHSEAGALPGEHPGRSRNPLIKVAGLAWLEFEKPDLEAAERFLADFGFTVADRTPDLLVLRGLPARAGLPARLGHRPAHPGQPDLRLLARHRPADVRALRRR